MGINKVQYGNTTLIDLTSDTVTADKLMQGYTAHDRTGALITGTATAPTLQTKSVSYAPTESAQTETVSADSGYDGLSQVNVSVSAISSTYVGSGITRRSSSDLTASGAAVTVPSGYYSAQASKSVASGTAGTPIATKGTVSNHQVSVTPSVTNTSGYISGGTINGTAVTVSASELVSGSETKTENGTYDVTNLAELVVNVSGGQTTEIIIPEQTITTTSSSTEVQVPIVNKPIVAGEEYIITVDGVSATATAESLYGGIWLYHIQGQVAIEQYNEVYFYTNSSYVGTHTVKVEKATGGGGATLIEKTITANGTYTATDDSADGYSKVTVNVPSGSSKNVQVLQSTSRTNASSLTKVLGDLTVSKTGTYDIYWSGGRSNTSSSYTWGTRLYVDGTGYGTENTTWTNNCQSNHLSNVSLTANQKLSVYARGRTGSYYTFAPMLVIIEV